MLYTENSDETVELKNDGDLSHKIIVSQWLTTYIFWYSRRNVTGRSFNKLKDHSLLDPMYTIGRALGLGQTKIFSVNGNRAYHLRRHSEADFTVTSLN